MEREIRRDRPIHSAKRQLAHFLYSTGNIGRERQKPSPASLSFTTMWLRALALFCQVRYRNHCLIYRNLQYSVALASSSVLRSYEKHLNDVNGMNDDVIGVGPMRVKRFALSSCLIMIFCCYLRFFSSQVQVQMCGRVRRSSNIFNERIVAHPCARLNN